MRWKKLWPHSPEYTLYGAMPVTTGTWSSSLNRFLDTYDNLWIDLSWSVIGKVCPDNRITDACQELLTIYSNRVFIGSDKIGNFENYGSVITRYKLLFDFLFFSVSGKIARINFFDLINQPQK